VNQVCYKNLVDLSRLTLVASLLCSIPALAQDQIQQARKLTAAGKPELALALYEEVLQKTPDSYEANLGAGMLLDLDGQYGKARKHLTKAIDVAAAQDKQPALRALAISYAFTGDCKNASKYEGQVFNAQEFTAAAETADEAGRICLESGALSEAERWYKTGHETALKKPDLSAAEKDLWALRWEHAQARIAARRGQHAEAVEHTAAVKAILDQGATPGQTTFYPYLTGYVAFYAGDYKAAVAELEKADQRDPFILSLLAQSLEKSGKKDAANELYHKILNINSHNPNNAFARPLARKKLRKTT
jgi:tetratricopeptide (TPR) repeat protein